MEGNIDNRLVNYTYIAPNQYRFRAGKSTTDAVGSLVNHAVAMLDEGKEVLGYLP